MPGSPDETSAVNGSPGLFPAVVLAMVTILALKMGSVWFYSSRLIERPWPFSSFLFQPQDRFTDYLIPYNVAGYHNIYNPVYWKAGGLIPPPYGFAQYAMLRYLPFRSSLVVTYGSYLVVLVAFVVLLWVLYMRCYSYDRPNRALYFIVFLVACYPLGFEVDRGNLDLFGAAIVAGLYCLTQRWGVTNWATAVLFALLVSLKPSFALLALPLVLCIPWYWVLAAGAVVAFNYAVPILFYGAKVGYLVKLVKSASTVTNGVSLFTHNLGSGLLAVGVHTGVAFDVAIGACLLACAIWVRYLIRGLDRRRVFTTVLTLAVLVTMIANYPSNDYQLIFLLPAFMMLPYLFPNVLGSVNGRRALGISLVLVFAYTNVYIPGVFDYYTVLRALAPVVVFGLFTWEAWMTRAAATLFRSERSGEVPLVAGHTWPHAGQIQPPARSSSPSVPQ